MVQAVPSVELPWLPHAVPAPLPVSHQASVSHERAFVTFKALTPCWGKPGQAMSLQLLMECSRTLLVPFSPSVSTFQTSLEQLQRFLKAKFSPILGFTVPVADCAGHSSLPWLWAAGGAC